MFTIFVIVQLRKFKQTLYYCKLGFRWYSWKTYHDCECQTHDTRSYGYKAQEL